MSDPRLEAIRQQDGWNGGPDKRKDTGQFEAWCHGCDNWQSEGHDKDCPWQTKAYLVALIDTLQRERDEAVRQQNLNAVAGVNVGEMLRAVEAQVSRLTEALRRIATLEPYMFHAHWDETLARRLQEIAKAVLASPPQEPQP